MTDLDLQKKLVGYTKKILEEQSLMRLDEQGLWQSFNVYANEVPVKTDYNDPYEQNYIIVLIGDEDEIDDKWRVEIQFIIGYADEDDNRQGHVITATLMNEIMQFPFEGRFVSALNFDHDTPPSVLSAYATKNESSRAYIRSVPSGRATI